MAEEIRRHCTCYPYAYKKTCQVHGEITVPTPNAPRLLRFASSTGSEADEDYCILCGAGPFRLSQLLTIMPETDPYAQLPEGEDWEPVRACRPCYRNLYGEPPNVAISDAEK